MVQQPTQYQRACSPNGKSLVLSVVLLLELSPDWVITHLQHFILHCTDIHLALIRVFWLRQFRSYWLSLPFSSFSTFYVSLSFMVALINTLKWNTVYCSLLLVVNDVLWSSLSPWIVLCFIVNDVFILVFMMMISQKKKSSRLSETLPYSYYMGSMWNKMK